MAINPELQRNLWIELTPHRLMAMPAILAGVFFLVHLTTGGRAAAMAGVALTAYLGLAVLWGARLASEAVVGEIQEHTWDIQRMSSLGAWTMTWGKLLGSTIYPWYGGLMCLGVYAATSDYPGSTLVRVLALLVAAGLFAQAVALLASLMSVGRRLHYGRSRAATHLILGLLAVAPFLSAGMGAGGVAYWYDGVYRTRDFALVSLVIVLAWAVTGIYRCLRGELQMRTGPWVWLGFAVFAAGYGAGFVQLPDVGGGHVGTARLFAAYSIVLLLAYVMVFVEPKDGVALRRLWDYGRRGRLAALLGELPRWLITVVLVAAFGAALLLRQYPEFLYRSNLFYPRAYVLASFLFLLRDAGLILYFNFGVKPARADATALLYLLVLYFLVPGILSLLHLHALAAALLPWRAGAGSLTVASGAVQAAVILWLAVRRWRDRFLRVAGPG